MNLHQYTRVSGVVFTLVAVVHAVRAFMGWDLLIGEVLVPVWGSVVAVAIAGGLAYQAYRLGK